MNQIVLSAYEKRVLQFINGDGVEPPVIPGAALWNCLERLQKLGLIHETITGQYLTREWQLTERGKELANGVWMA